MMSSSYLSHVIAMDRHTILGAVIGDVIGSVHEGGTAKTTDFDLYDENCDFTDDTVLTIAVADSLLHDKSIAKTVQHYGRAYINRGFGNRFLRWLYSGDLQPYNSFGNGSAMRVSSVGFLCNTIESVLNVAEKTAAITHNHAEGIKGAKATAAAVFLAHTGASKADIKQFIIDHFYYNLDFTLDSIRPVYLFDETCQGSVPHAIVAFLESMSFEHSIRLAISLGGDSDTIACIAGGIAAAYYQNIPQDLARFVLKRLPAEFITIISQCNERVFS